MEWSGWSLDTDALKDTKYISVDVVKVHLFILGLMTYEAGICKLAYIWL